MPFAADLNAATPHGSKSQAQTPIDASPLVQRPFESTDEHSVDGHRSTLIVQETEFDSIEEVDAVARSLRRVALEYGMLLLAVLVAVPVLSAAAPWWFARPVLGGLTLGFLMVAVLLHVVFIGIAAAYTRFANHIEDEMLGRPETENDFDG